MWKKDYLLCSFCLLDTLLTSALSSCHLLCCSKKKKKKKELVSFALAQNRRKGRVRKTAVAGNASVMKVYSWSMDMQCMPAVLV